ncbi:MAG: DNA-formamidopyrimidine glycosylase [Candidatus Methylacidiphilales bacterium]
MPELAEVEYFRKRWAPGFGQRVIHVDLHASARVFRGCDAAALEQGLSGATLRNGWSRGKQMLFGFSGGRWLGVHLGMTGELAEEPPGFSPGKHDHLILRQHRRSLVFRDPRLFGRIRFDQSPEPPSWWQALPPGVLEAPFTRDYLAGAARRRAGTPLKAFLLLQEHFPGIGNWMADEILWRCQLAPQRKAGTLTPTDLRRLHREIRHVARTALRIIGETWGDLPDSWLFHHRWKDGGRCPRTGMVLVRETVGGRTTCWSPAWQR